MRNTKLISALEGAIVVAAAVALSYVPLNLPNAAFDLSLGLVPLAVYSLRRGAAAGIFAGALWGLLLIVLGKAYIITAGDSPKYFFYLYLQPILEYPIAFAMGGMGGVFARKLRKAFASQKSIVLIAIFSGVLAACARWFVHFWAGVLFWGAYAPEGMGAFVYSGAMNGASAIANAIMLAAILAALVKNTPRLFVTEK